MSDLVEFLRARLDDDEQAAREAGNRRWLVQDNIIELYPEREDDGFIGWPTRADARHAARWEPARVLREVEAKRRIIDEHEVTDQGCETCGNYDPTGLHEQRTDGPCETLRLLALPYADHPDYREEWKP